MIKTILAGLSLIDSTGQSILTVTLATLVLGIVANLWLRVRYAAIAWELRREGRPERPFQHRVLQNIVRDAGEATQRAGDWNVQAIIEERFQCDLRAMLLGERFVRSSTGLVIILGLLGTFYGLTLSIGRIVQLVTGEPGAAADITSGVSQGLSHALAGMTVAFSNSLVGVLSAVILMVFGILSNVSDRRTAVMVQIETFLERTLPRQSSGLGRGAELAGFSDSVARLDEAIARFDGALQSFATTTRDFREFNLHLKDNVQRLSLAFADLSETLKAHTGALRSGPRN